MQQFDIYQVKTKWRLAEYPRPCVIVAVSPLFFTVALISSSFDMCNLKLDFIIDNDHPDFPKTGLDRKSYIIGQAFPKQKKEDFLFKRGYLSGSLLDDFKEWFGE